MHDLPRDMVRRVLQLACKKTSDQLEHTSVDGCYSDDASMHMQVTHCCEKPSQMSTTLFSSHSR